MQSLPASRALPSSAKSRKDNPTRLHIACDQDTESVAETRPWIGVRRDPGIGEFSPGPGNFLRSIRPRRSLDEPTGPRADAVLNDQEGDS